MSEIKKPTPVRRPGSQVAPGQKPLFRPGKTASTHSRVPMHVATAGKLYRVRDRKDANDEAIVWGDLLTHEEANRLKESVVGQRMSTTARIEEMTPVEITEARELLGQVEATGDNATTMPIGGAIDHAPTAPLAVPTAAPHKLPPGESPQGIDYSWLNEVIAACGADAGRWAIEFTRKATERGIRLSKDDESFIHVWFQNMPLTKKPSQLEELRARALAAAAPIARQAQANHDARPKPRKPVVEADPPKPPPSPLSDDLVELEDGGPSALPPEEETLDAGEVADLSAEVGGAPSSNDIDRARKQAEADADATTADARSHYETAVRQDPSQTWPTWDKLGEFEHAAWRYYANNGGDAPALVKEPRKVGHSMGTAP